MRAIAMRMPLRLSATCRRSFGSRQARGPVRCACGSLKAVRIEHLQSGGVQSCGCLHGERMVTWRRVREDDDAEVVGAQSRTDERLPMSDLRRVMQDRLNCL